MSEGGDVVEAWLTSVEKYFEIRDYIDNMKAIWEAYQLTREAFNWWENKKVELGLRLASVT